MYLRQEGRDLRRSVRKGEKKTNSINRARFWNSVTNLYINIYLRNAQLKITREEIACSKRIIIGYLITCKGVSQNVMSNLRLKL